MVPLTGASIPTSDLRDQLQATLSGSYTIERELGGGDAARVRGKRNRAGPTAAWLERDTKQPLPHTLALRPALPRVLEAHRVAAVTQQTDRLNTALDGRYRILRHLGEGGMATVYLCEDLKHDRQVALKLLKPELAAVLGAERFVQEIKTTAALQHPHILPLFDSGAADGFLFYVMPFIDGETLRAKARSRNAAERR
ncbi:MAG: protein kinase [Gemmatimonadaceae bacterium]|nr:protein kinase [Gemmatimonadaceae bacterium]